MMLGTRRDRTEAAHLSSRNTSFMGVLLGAIIALASASPALAAPPTVSAAPTITGTAVVGATLTATGGTASGPSGTTYGVQWARCTSATDESTCEVLWAADQPTYKLTGDDLGKRV